MEGYRYKVRQRGGSMLKGTIWAESKAAAGMQLAERYGLILSLQAIPFWQKPVGLGGPLTFGQRELFFRQLGILLAGGLPVLKALHVMGLGAGPKLAALCRDMEGELGEGHSLSQSLARHKKQVGELAAGLAEAGEKSGRVPDLLTRLAAYYKMRQKNRRLLLQAALYPALVLGLSCCIGLLFLWKVLPIFLDVYQALGLTPAPLLQMVLEISQGKARPVFFAALLAGVGSILYGFIQYGRTLVFRLPLARQLLRQFWEAQLLHLLVLLLQGGVNLPEALRGAGKILPDTAWRQRISAMEKQLLSGSSLTHAAAGCGELFSPLTREFMSLGEESGQLPHMLEEAASLAEEKFQQKMKTVRTLVEPALLLVLALMSGGLLYLVLSPLLSMMNGLPML